MAGANGKHPLLNLFVRRKAILALHKEQGFSMPDARQMVADLSDKELTAAVEKVAKAKGVEIPKAAEGDHPFIDFINAHWADILAIILKLLGI